MKNTTIIILSLISSISLYSQEILQVSQGSAYAQQVFVNLANNDQQAIEHSDWDIAFGVSPRSSAIIVNEGVSLGGSSVSLFSSSASDFETADTTQIIAQILNDEVSWGAGAFNHVASADDPFDLGWGVYDPSTHNINGSRIFFMIDRSGTYRKLEILSLARGVYTVRYALLDGTEETTLTLSKSDFPGKSFAYLSFDSGILDLEPEDWHLLFTRYTTPLPDGQGGTVQYGVTGVLQGNGISVAELRGVDPEAVTVPTENEAYSTELTTIGHDWKNFDLGTYTWSLPDDLVYLVRDAEDHVYAIQFLDFEGSSTGTSTLSVNDMGVLSSNQEILSFVNTASLYPNPAKASTNFEFELSENAQIHSLSIRNTLGQFVKEIQLSSTQLYTGKNTIAIDLSGLVSGQYLVSARLNNGVVTSPLVIR